jgi:hypothetical protein
MLVPCPSAQQIPGKKLHTIDRSVNTSMKVQYYLPDVKA